MSRDRRIALHNGLIAGQSFYVTLVRPGSETFTRLFLSFDELIPYIIAGWRESDYFECMN